MESVGGGGTGEGGLYDIIHEINCLSRLGSSSFGSCLGCRI